MSREFPDWIDPWKAADGRRSFQGTIPLKWMERLAPLLAPLDWPDARFSATFDRDREGTVVVDLKVEAELPLVCQRSLRPYLEPIVRHSRLAVVPSAEEADRLPGHYEPALAEQGRLALQDLVEDELLLGLPEVPRDPRTEAVRRSTDPQHGDAQEEVGQQAKRQKEDRRQSGAEAEDGSQRTHRPFEGLADLLRERKD